MQSLVSLHRLHTWEAGPGVLGEGVKKWALLMSFFYLFVDFSILRKSFGLLKRDKGKEKRWCTYLPVPSLRNKWRQAQLKRFVFPLLPRSSQCSHEAQELIIPAHV